MDPKTLLDYALFQLTPTRTRCDLVVFSGKKNEKLASGLVDPFLSHLKYAKDEISKGGYSITLRLPATDHDASWFTKATFQRFVRFVSTPEILERIVRVEKEILQIESSIQSNEIVIREVTGHPREAADRMTKKSSNSSKLNPEEVDGAAHEENSKIHLQRLMDTRKALLLKEQAMAYARAVVAGYEIDTIDDLICFADTFGASRLRVACTDFKELYKKKHSDDQWMDELAAVQAYPVADLSFLGTSGIVIAGDNIHGNVPRVRTVSSEPISDTTPNSGSSKENNSASDQTPNVQQVPWMNQVPQYMYNYQGPMPPYQGYPFPGMHSTQQYYAGHMGWPMPGGVPSKNQKNHKSSRRKDRSADTNGTDASEEDEETASSDSSGTDVDEDKEHEKKHVSKGHKRNKNKTSKTVVIRNINYITSQRRNGEENGASDDSSSLDESSIREGVDDALASLEKHNHSKPRKNRAKWGSVAQNGSNGFTEENDANNSGGGKVTNHWGAFQDLLMSREEPNENNKSMEEHFVMRNSIDGLSENTGNLYLESEKIKMKKPSTADDSVLAIQRDGESAGKANMMDFANGEYIHMHPSGKKNISENENSLLLKHSEESRKTLPDFSSESSTAKSRIGEDWFVVNSSGGSVPHEAKGDTLSFERDIIRKEANARSAVVDDSFIIESRPAVVDPYVSNWRTDIGMEADIDRNENVGEKIGISMSAEPDDFCAVLMRESQESIGASWTPEMVYEAEISYNEAEKASPVKANGHAKVPVADVKIAGGKKNAGGVVKNMGKDAKSKALVSKSRLDFLSKSKKAPSIVHKSKFEKEEEERKRTEELRIQRQKRIAERTAVTGATMSKKVPVGNKTNPSKLVEKNTMKRLSL